MSEVRVRLKFIRHPLTNHTYGTFTMRNEDCDECGHCRCEEGAYCCGSRRHTAFCPDCGDELEQPYCYSCNTGETCGNCGETVSEDAEVTYTGTVVARWINGALAQYDGYGHPHLDGSYCLGGVANLFENVHTTAQAVEAVVTHISNINLRDAINGSGPYTGIEVR